MFFFLETTSSICFLSNAGLKELPGLELDKLGLCSIGKHLFTMCYSTNHWSEACWVLDVCQKLKYSFLVTSHSAAGDLMIQALKACVNSGCAKLASHLITGKVDRSVENLCFSRFNVPFVRFTVLFPLNPLLLAC